VVDNVDLGCLGPAHSGEYGDVPGSIQSVERAAAILQLVAESSSPPGLTDVAESLDLAKATAYGLLHTLQEVGFLVQDDTGRAVVLFDYDKKGRMKNARVDQHDSPELLEKLGAILRSLD